MVFQIHNGLVRLSGSIGIVQRKGTLSDTADALQDHTPTLRKLAANRLGLCGTSGKERCRRGKIGDDAPCLFLREGTEIVQRLPKFRIGGKPAAHIDREGVLEKVL